MTHTIPIRIYYEDTDAGGIVYHSRYLNFGERGRTEYLRALGFQNSELEKEIGVGFVVRHIDINYLKPAVLDDELKLLTRVCELKNTSFIMSHSFTNQRNELICEMMVALVCVDMKSVRPVRLPPALKDKFECDIG